MVTPLSILNPRSTILDPDDTVAERDGGSRAGEVHRAQHRGHPGQGELLKEQVEIAKHCASCFEHKPFQGERYGGE